MEISKPETISRFKKHRFLLEMSEDRFRDEVVRPLFFRQGFADGRDLCGPSESGKDALFVTKDRLGIEDVYVIQTKKGNINLSSKVSENLLQAITQLKTAGQTNVKFIANRKKQLPAKVILCASGKINESARAHIAEEVNDPRLVFLDSDELIPKIDELYPELWLGIDADIAPYFRKLKQIIESSDDTILVSELLPKDSQVGVATDRGFVMLQLYQTSAKLKKIRGQFKKIPHFVQMPVTALLTKRRPLTVVFGGAGYGKSTALKRLAYMLAARGLKADSQEKLTIPILLRAQDIAGNLNRSLVELCDIESRRLTGLSTSSFSPADLNAGRVLVLVDALDEIPGEGVQILVLSVIKQFHQNYPKSSVIVTSRDNESVKGLAALSEFDKYNLSPINYKQAQQIIRSLQKGKSLPAEKSEELVRRLEEVHGMELSPLLVTVFAATSDYARQDIPANLTELFKKFTEMMLGRWDATKGFSLQYHAPLKDFILTKVAFEMHRRKLTNISVNEFDSIIKTELEKRGHEANLEQLRDEMLYRSGLFMVADGLVEFRHLLLQEFFAGRGIPSNEFLNSVVTDGWWRRAIVFYFGDHAGDSAALHATIDATRGRTIEENYYSALTLGLALQACYLVEVKDKVDIYTWVVDAISDAAKEFLDETDPEKKFPLRQFIFYYLFGRDSVALSVLESRVQDILDKWNDRDLSPEARDMRRFWTICGLIECGALTEVEQLVEDFDPSDGRLLLAVHLGSYLSDEIRVSTKRQRDAAKRICDRLSTRIDHLRTKLFEEMTSELLEIRQGTVKAIEVQSTSSEMNEDPKKQTA